MRALGTIGDLEAVVGTRPQSMMMKAVDELDDGCRGVLQHSPIAGFGFRDDTGAGWATIVGGPPGFVRALSPTQLTFDQQNQGPSPGPDAWVSLVMLLPGIGETLRITGQVSTVVSEVVTVEMSEAWIHCAKCIRRSQLWDPVNRQTGRSASPPSPDGAADRLGGPEGVSILQAARFAMVTSWDRDGRSDTSPRGDRPGFIQILDRQTVAIPDRKGNRRTDTFHNLLECDDLAIAAIVPGSAQVLHLRGRAFVTDDAALRASMALNDRPPHAVLVLEVGDATVVANDGIRIGRMWDASVHVNPDEVPDLMALGATHLASSNAKGVKAAATKVLSMGLAANPRFFRKGVEHGYRKELGEEGF